LRKIAAASIGHLARGGWLVNNGRTVFSQLIDFLPEHTFSRCVCRYNGERRVRKFSCWDQFLCLAFAQLTFRESLRDTIICLRAVGGKLYHSGIRGHLAHSTFADANEKRDWRIYADFAQALIKKARGLYQDESIGVELENTAYAFDSTTVDLCLSLFPWAQFRRHKSAVKLHTLIDLRGNIPCFIHITSGRVTDMTVLDYLPLEPGAFYLMDRGYVDFARLYRFTQAAAFFIIRAKGNLDFTRRSYRKVDRHTGLRSDQTIVFAGPKSSTLYPDPLRRIAFYATDLNKRFVFLTNNLTLPALTIAQLYKCRWQVELFFKWIKQHLHIKAFYGTTPNAVKVQVWSAISIYVLVAIVKKQLGISRNLSEILQILSISLFEKIDIYEALTSNSFKTELEAPSNQLNLFNI
jgi:uncharacterized protein DUF4372/DDE family transposase